MNGAAALIELRYLADELIRPPSLVESHLRRVAEATIRTTATTRPAEDVLEALRAELQEACSRGRAADLPPRILRRAPMVFWDREPQAAGFPGLVEVVLQGARARPRLLREIIEAWMRDFGPDRIRLPEVGNAVGRMLPGYADPRLSFWAAAHERFRTFDAEAAPRVLGQALIDGRDELDNVLRVSGLDDPLRAEGKFFRATLEAMLELLPHALRSPAAVLSWRRAEAMLETRREAVGISSRSMLRIPVLAAPVITGCMTPWLDGPPPTHAPRKAIEGFLTRVVGDPRLKPDHWNAVSPRYGQLMRAWLAKATLEAFFELISDSTKDERWPYRRAFWRACLRQLEEESRPGEVWVVLSPDLAQKARRFPELRDGHGRIAATDQAVLLMRLGELILSEWSDIGPIRAWSGTDDRAPRLYAREYEREELRGVGLYFPHETERKLDTKGRALGKGLPHHQAESGRWQQKAAEMLRQRLGLRLNPAEYMRL